MPPKSTATTASSKAGALVPVGPREVQTTKRSRRNEDGTKPTTARALILRNGKHGARGTGEIVHATRILGREKLDLIAEDLVERSHNAIMNPFRLSDALKIADSQTSSFLDDISNLQDPVIFVPIIEAEWNASIPRKDPKAQEPLKSATAVARLVASKIHNTYMLASAWKIVSDALHDLEDDGLEDGSVQTQLQSNATLRAKYLCLYNFVSYKLFPLLQMRFANLATTTTHYAQYFKKVKQGGEVDDTEEYAFDWDALKAAGKSFIDSIILEICFPKASYPMMVLYQILSEAIGESPKEAKRFPQALWDAAGDLSACVELLAMLDTPLLGPAAAGWKDLPLQNTPAVDQWLDAEDHSAAASEDIASFKDIIFPLAKAKKKQVLENMWKAINLSYKAATKKDIDTLWQLQDALTRTPQWHTIYIPGHILDLDEDGKKGTKKVLAITNGEDSDDSMPSLQSVSNSSEDDSDESDSDDDDEEGEEGDESESEYNEEYEDEIRDLVREAMDVVYEGDLFDKPKGGEDGEREKGNAFLKLLGSLRGRFINPSPKLKTKTTPIARGPKTGFFGSGKKKKGPKPPQDPADASAGLSAPKSQQATVEEVEDEDDKPATPKKKKKKPKKKKKKAASTDPTAGDADGDGDGDDDEVEEPAGGNSVTSPPTSPTPAKRAAAAKQSAALAGMTAQMSSVSLLSTEQTTAQSAHSYLKSENLLDSKTKVKSRAAASTEPTPGKKKGFLSKFGLGPKAMRPDEPKKARTTWFSRLSKKATASMHQLLRTSEDETRGLASMKWETFLKLMREMGFTYDPSTAGSSVRFHPPDPNDVSISFHKPHPDPTIHPVMLREYAKKLKKNYGWSEEDFLDGIAT